MRLGVAGDGRDLGSRASRLSEHGDCRPAQVVEVQTVGDLRLLERLGSFLVEAALHPRTTGSVHEDCGRAPGGLVERGL